MDCGLDSNNASPEFWETDGQEHRDGMSPAQCDHYTVLTVKEKMDSDSIIFMDASGNRLKFRGKRLFYVPSRGK